MVGTTSASGLFIDKRNKNALLDGSIVKQSIKKQGKNKMNAAPAGCCAGGEKSGCLVF